MGMFGGLFKKKQEESQDLSKKFGDNVVDEIERLNAEFKSQSLTPPPAPEQPSLPPEPEPVRDGESAGSAVPDTFQEPPEIPEEPADDEPRTIQRKPLPKSVPTKKVAAKSEADFDSKIEKLRKRIETGSEVKSVHLETSKKLEALKEDFNKKLNSLIDQVRDVNSSFKRFEKQDQAIVALQEKAEELQAHVDDLGLQVREVEKMEALRKDIVSLKNAAKGIKNYDDAITQLQQQAADNAEKLKQLLTLVEMLSER